MSVSLYLCNTVAMPVKLLILLTVYVSIVQKSQCSPIDGDINKQGTVDFETDNQIEKMKTKLLLGLGLDSIPTETISKEEIPSALLADIFTDADSTQYGNGTGDVRFEEEEIVEKKIMVMSQLDSIGKCGTKDCMKISFHRELDPTDLDIVSAELWVYSDTVDKSQSSKMSIHTSKKRKRNNKNVIHVSHSTSQDGGWFATQVKIGQILRHSKRNNGADKDVKFQAVVKCDNCRFSEKKKHSPFVSLKTVSRKKKIARRSTEDKCTSTGCCRKSLIVNFKDIGWDTWVYYPESYNAYYCKGNCSGATHSFQHKHTGVIKAVSEQKNRKDIPFCCTPKKFSSLSMIYMHKGSIIRRAIPNMIVDDCWCI